MTIAVNLISGTLGAGKTTLLRQFLQQKPADENWLLLVNEFGAVGIDGAILEASGNTEVELVPGGCICCTAQGELKQTLTDIAQKSHIDRLLIEPTGLGEPDTIVDLFLALDLKAHYQIDALFSVFDLSSLSLNELQSMTIMQSLLSMADVIILNKADQSDHNKTQQILTHCQNVFPPKEHILVTEQSQAPKELLYFPHFQPKMQFRPLTKAQPLVTRTPHAMNSGQTEVETHSPLPNCLQRIIHTDLNTQAIGWLFRPEQAFDWPKLQTLFEQFASRTDAKRAKGVFRIGNPWMLFQAVNQQTTRELIAYRKDSRLELLLDKTHTLDLNEFEGQLQSCMK